MLRTLFCVLLALHGAIHVLGFLKAFNLADLPQLKHPISPMLGLLWLAAAIGFGTTAVLFGLSQRHWWIVAVASLALSTALIVAAWTDARFGLVANVIIAVPSALALLNLRSSSFQSVYEREVERSLEPTTPPEPVTEADLAKLPKPVQKYLWRAGVVGKPRVGNFKARFTGGLRGGPDGAWMPTRAEQHDFFDPSPRRIFLAHASRYGIPFEALHLYADGTASMEVRVVSLVKVVDVRGPEMDQSETVTLFNDMCLLAPATLVTANVRWQEVDANHVLGTFTNGQHTISALLTFDADGDLTNFLSNDRYQLDGKTKKRLPWVTPVSQYRDFGGTRLAAYGEARWTDPEGQWAYARFNLETIEYNVPDAASPSRVAQRPRSDTRWPAATEGPASGF